MLLQCVAVCGSMLMRYLRLSNVKEAAPVVAVFCSTCCSVLLQCVVACVVAVCCSVRLQCIVAVCCCSALQRNAVCCSVLQRAAVCCSVLQCVVVFVRGVHEAVPIRANIRMCSD